MSVFNTTQLLDALAPFMVRGRLIHVDLAVGNDTTGDGSKGNPYLTPNRGIQDLRSDKNDILIIDNNSATSVSAPGSYAAMEFFDLKNFMVLGVGGPSFGLPPGKNAITNIQSWTRLSGTQVQIVTTAAHNLAVNDWILVEGADGTGNCHPNGFWSVAAVTPPTTATLTYIQGMTNPSGSGANQPYTGGAQGFLYVANTIFHRCSNYLIAGINFGTFPGNGWTAVFQHGDRGILTSSSYGRNGKFYGCSFNNATLGYGWLGGTNITFDIDLSGTNYRVEKCVFTNTKTVYGTFNGSAIAINSLNDLVVSECILFGVNIGGSPNWTKPFRWYGLNETKYGALITANLINNTEVPLATLYGPARGTGVDKANHVLHRNYYTAQPYALQATVSSDGKIDEVPMSFINQDNVPSHWDLMWGSYYLDKNNIYTMGQHVTYALGGITPPNGPGVARARPGDAMDLITDALDADAVATSGAQEIRDEILDDATRFSGGNIDASISSVLTAIAALHDLETADITAAVWGVTEASLAAAGPTGLMLAIGLSRNTQIDFTGDDLLGWQLVVNNTAGSEIARADLYDEANARIPASMTVAAFIGAQKTISRVVPS